MIFYFSATGNCKYVATRIAEATKESMVSIVDCIEDNTWQFQIGENECIGIIAPTYVWGIPTIVATFLERVQFIATKKPYVYYIATFGTTPARSGQQANRYLKKYAGIEVDAYYSVKMPDTWTPFFDLSDKSRVARINEEVEPQLEKVITRIQGQQRGNFMQRQGLSILSLVYPVYRYLRRTKHLKLKASCNGCGVCAKKCPAHAIAMQAGTPVWKKDQCIMCLGCLHRCPQFAIQYENMTGKHGQYQNPHVTM